MSKREKFLLAGLFVIIVMYGYYQILLSPIQHSIDLLVEENRRLGTQIVEAEQTFQQEEGAVLSEQEIVLRLGGLLQRVPDHPCIPEGIAFIEESAKTSGAVLLKAGLEPEYPSSSTSSELEEINHIYQYRILSITAQGDYESLLLLIDKLENRAVRIYDIVCLNVRVPLLPFPQENLEHTNGVKTYFYDHSGMIAEMKIRIYYSENL